MNSSRTSKRRVGRQLTIGLLTAGFLSAGLAAPAYAAGTNTVTSPGVINIANAGSLVINGTAASGVGVVTVALTDPSNPSVLVDATVTPDPAGGNTWSATISAADVAGLAEGPVQILATFDGACIAADCSPDAIVTKDTVAPEAPTAFPDAFAVLTAATNIDITSLDPTASTFFTTGTPTALDPTAADTAVSGPYLVSTTQEVKAIAIDPAGNRSPIMVANYTVTIPAAPTTTTLAVSPASPQVAGTPVNLSASVTPAATPGTFEFFDGPTSLGSAPALGGTATNTLTSTTVGTHSFTATFTPTNTTAFTPSTSGPAAYTITAPLAATTSTTLVLTPPSTQLVGTPLLLSASVNPTGTPGTFEFFDGPASMGPGSASATMNVTPAAGTHTYTAKFTPTNLAAFTASTSPALTITITTPPAPAPTPPPVTAPKVISRTPAAGATGVSRVNNVMAVFSKNVTGVSARSFTLRTRAGAAVPSQVTYNPTTRMAMLNPVRTLAADTTYVATLSGAISAGKTLPVTTWAFTTGPRPTLAARTPGVNAKHVARNANVTLKFSETVTGVSGSSLTLVTTTGRRVPAVVTYNRTTKIATLNPVRALSARTRYTVRVTSAIKDRAGNPLTATRWSFTTA